MLGKRGGAFTNSIINVVRNSSGLRHCSPASVMSAAVVAATLNLPIDPALGQAAIVPYGKVAVFQLMYKGLIQLCIRSGMYQTIHCSEIYKDELKSHNPITGIVKFKDPDTFKMRYESKYGENVVGHYAYFKLVSGFEKSDYMTKEQVMAHAEKYSKAYQYDLREKKEDSPWSINPIQMGNKTVLIRLLGKYGIKSIEMQDALFQDNSFEAAESAAAKKIESEQGSEPVDAEFENKAEAAEKSQAKPKAKRAKNTTKKEKDNIKFLYTCKACGLGFDEPRISGTDARPVTICPNTKCLSIVATEDEKQTPPFMED
jgi:recombination protein RecT